MTFKALGEWCQIISSIDGKSAEPSAKTKIGGGRITPKNNRIKCWCWWEKDWGDDDDKGDGYGMMLSLKRLVGRGESKYLLRSMQSQCSVIAVKTESKVKQNKNLLKNSILIFT